MGTQRGAFEVDHAGYIRVSGLVAFIWLLLIKQSTRNLTHLILNFRQTVSTKCIHKHFADSAQLFKGLLTCGALLKV